MLVVMSASLILSDSSQVVFASGCSGKSREHYASQARQAVFPRLLHFDYVLILDLELLVRNFPFAYQCLPAFWCTHTVPRSTWVRDSRKTYQFELFFFFFVMKAQQILAQLSPS